MKLLLLIFFVALVSPAVFVTSILYGGITGETFKNALNDATVYQHADSFLTASNGDTEELTALLKNRFTSDYLQLKTEEAIDASFDYVTGVNDASPSVSFRELKTDITKSNPELLTSLEGLSKELETTMQSDEFTDSESFSAENTDTQMAEVNAMLTLAKGDFTIDLRQYLEGVRSGYKVLRIFHPLLILLLTLSLLGIALLAKPLSSKFRWVGVTLLVSGIVGFISVLSNGFIMTFLSEMTIKSSTGLASFTLPVILQLFKEISSVYGSFQTSASTGMLIIGLIMLIASFVIKSDLRTVKKTLPITSKVTKGNRR